jgi:hypothetical protein
MAINSVTDLRNTDPGQTPFTVLHNPLGGSTACHAMQVTQKATSGAGAGINIVSDNTEAPAIRTRAAGPLLQLCDASNSVKFEVANTGAVTMTGALTVTSLALSGNATVGGTLGVTGATTLSTVSTSDAATLNSAAVTGNATVGGTLGVTGAATMSSTLAVTGTSTLTGAVTASSTLSAGSTTVNGDLSVLGSGKSYRFRSSGGALDTDFGGNDWYWSNFPNADFTGTQRTYMRWENAAATIHMVAELQCKADVFGARVHSIDGANNKLGFHGADPVAKQTVAGSRDGNAALASLITALATLGLVTDGTSA